MELLNIQDTSLREGKNWSYRSDDTNEWIFPWLINHFTSLKWHIDIGNENFSTLNFNVYIPTTGEYLATPKYYKLVNTIKKVLALSRTGHLSNSDDTTSLATRANSTLEQWNSLKILSLFLIKIYGGNSVARHGFNLLTEADLQQFHMEIAIGRSDKASGLIDVVFNKLTTLSVDEAQAILKIENIKRKKEKFSIKPLLKACSFPDMSVSNFTSKIIINRITEIFPSLTLPITGKKARKITEFPNSCPPFYEDNDDDDQGIGKTTFESLITAPKLLSKFCFYLPELSDYSNPSVEITKAFCENYIRLKKRTPNIPTYTALFYLNEAIRLVALYGDDIVKTKRHCEEQLNILHAENPSIPRHRILSNKQRFEVTIPINSFTTDYCVTRYNNLASGATHQDRRNNVTVLYAYRMLVAAAYILIHTFCIKRYSENLELQESDLKNGLWGGSELHFGIRKSAPTEQFNLRTGRPVPDIVADAVSLLSDANLHYYDDSEDPYLFPSQYTSNSIGEPPKNKKMSRTVLINILADFSDFIEVPTDMCNGVESRFYLYRTHVIRRFGAKAFYALTELEDFPALTWLMGHASMAETWRYLLEDVENDDLSEEAAFSVLDALYKSNIDTSQVESMISSQLDVMFNDRSPEAILQYLQKQISAGVKVYKYVDESGRIILYMENQDE
ncbi:hypothetical protein ACSTIZ_04895 [Vibrio parahaemolyticus]